MLHKLGVAMHSPGGSFVYPDRNNRHGTFEDAELMTLTRRVLAQKVGVEVFVPAFRERAQQPLWGFKVPAFVEIAHEALPLLAQVADVRLVAALRSREACIVSYRQAYGGSLESAVNWYDARYAVLLRVLAAWAGEVLELDWAQTLRDSLRQARVLAGFVFRDGLAYPDCAAIERAAAHIERKGHVNER
jgi:hypothetical protein